MEDVNYIVSNSMEWLVKLKDFEQQNRLTQVSQFEYYRNRFVSLVK